jgi:hypothetical protein
VLAAPAASVPTNVAHTHGAPEVSWLLAAADTPASRKPIPPARATSRGLDMWHHPAPTPEAVVPVPRVTTAFPDRRRG